ncbi:MAG: Uma2 family endonuclease [Cytophagales bacterium]
MSAFPSIKYSIEDYLQFEGEALEKSEYYGGEMLMMAAASVSHNRINENISIEAGYNLKRKRCQSFCQDLRIFIPDNTLFTYPDLILLLSQKMQMME